MSSHPRDGRISHPDRPPAAPRAWVAFTDRVREAVAARAFPALTATLVALAVGALATPAQAATAFDSTATLIWNAPGDDGSTGVAAQYDLRYRTTPVAGTDTLAWWNSATRVTNLPAPRTAGQVDSVQVRNLTPSQTYYFILRTADEVPNWSNYSNVAIRLPYSDTIAPMAINDLSALPPGGSPGLPSSSSPTVAPSGAALPRRK